MRELVQIKPAGHPRYDHLLVWKEGGKRLRKYLVGSITAARREAEIIKARIAGSEADDAPMSRTEWEGVRSARVADVNIKDAVALWLETMRKRGTSITVADMAQERMAVLRRKDGYSARYTRDIERICTLMSEEWGTLMLDEVTATHIEDLMYRKVVVIQKGRKRTGRVSHKCANAPAPATATVTARRRLMHGIFAWAVRKRWITANPVLATEPVRSKRDDLTEKSALTPHQCRALLLATAAKAPRMLPFISIAMFAGLRTEELHRIKWANIQTDRGLIIVEGKVAKTRSRRIVSIQPPLAAILAQVPRGEPTDNVMPVNSKRLLDRINKTAGWRGTSIPDEPLPDKTAPVWPRNALRKTFVSYHLAFFQNAHETALQSGHSEDVLFKHYREVVSPEDADEFWSITLEHSAATHQHIRLLPAA